MSGFEPSASTYVVKKARRWPRARAAQEGVHVVLYDGVCGLCDRSVRFLLDVDREGVLHYSPLQGELAGRLSQRRALDLDLGWVVFVEEMGSDRERVSTASTAVLRILHVIGGPWSFLYWLRLVPRPLRDLVYGWIASGRYRWFGKFDSCKVPSPELRRRFLS